MGQEQSGEIEASTLRELEEGRKSQFAIHNRLQTVKEQKPRRGSVRKSNKKESLGGIDGNPHEIFKEDESISSDTTLNKKSFKSITESSQTPQKPKREEKKVSVPFVWRHGGNQVLVTGSFWNWNRKEEMFKTGNQFQRILDLDRGVHQYKFIVDGEWRFAPEEKKIKDDGGNINNYIDTEEFRAQFQKSQERSKPQPQCHTKKGEAQKEYSLLLPTPLSFATSAAVIQPQQHRHFLTFQPPDAKYYKNLEYSPDLPKHRKQSEGLPLPPHSLVNHIAHSRRNDVGGNVLSMTTMTYPVRNKYVTTVYYKYENTE